MASKTAAFRLALLGGVDGVPPIEALDESPSSPRRWQARYGGCYVLVTKEDREQGESGAGVYLGTASYEALRTFRRVRRASPPAGRLNQAAAALGWAEARYDSWAAVEVYHVPPAAGE